MKKKPTKFKGLSPNCHYSHAKEYVDIDYKHKLSDEEAQWLSNFMDNYYGGRFAKDDEQNPIKDRKETWRRGHARRRDFMSSKFKSRVDLSSESDSFVDSTDIDQHRVWKSESENE